MYSLHCRFHARSTSMRTVYNTSPPFLIFLSTARCEVKVQAAVLGFFVFNSFSRNMSPQLLFGRFYVTPPASTDLVLVAQQLYSNNINVLEIVVIYARDALCDSSCVYNVSILCVDFYRRRDVKKIGSPVLRTSLCFPIYYNNVVIIVVSLKLIV